MAALTYRFPAPPKYAGAQLGLSAKDLADKYGLNEDKDDEGTVVELGGPFYPTTTTTTYKGRGARTLGYQTGGAPTVEQTVFGQAPLSYKPIEQEAPTEEEPETVEDRFLRSFISDMGNQEVLGAEALGRAKEYGYSTEDILQKAAEEGLTFGEQAATSLGKADLGQYITELGDPNKQVIGLEALTEARKTMSDDLIKSLAEQQGRSFGQKAAESLGVPSFDKISDLSQYVDVAAGGDPARQNLGLTAVESARKAGLSNAQIISQAQQQGKTFAQKAAESLNVPSFSQISDLGQYVDVAAGGDPARRNLGLTAVEAARQAGLSNAQIISQAQQQGKTFAQKAAESLNVPSFSQISDLGQYVNVAAGGDPARRNLGRSAVEAARRAGLSNSQIIDLAQQQGRTFASGARQSLGL